MVFVRNYRSEEGEAWLCNSIPLVKETRSIRSNQSSQGITIELLSDKVPMPVRKNPELMVYKKNFEPSSQSSWIDKEDNIRFANDGIDDLDLKLAPICR